MKRSEVNAALQSARQMFERHGWALPPNPQWDITDFGLGNFQHQGLVLINLANEPEYCEKLMYAAPQQLTPAHHHKKKKEDIICRNGGLIIQLWADYHNAVTNESTVDVKINNEWRKLRNGSVITLRSGERITIPQGLWHEFKAGAEGCVIGEVSTANDDENDNFFANPDVGRFATIVEDEPAMVRLVNEK